MTVSGPQPQLRFAPVESAGRNARKGTRPVYFAQTQRFVDCAVYDRFALVPGKHLRGPAVIEEYGSTTLIGPDDTFTIGTLGEIRIACTK